MLGKSFLISKTPYAIFMIGGALSSVIKQFVYAKFLTVDDFGYYSLVFLIQSYGIYLSTIGMHDGLLRELTVHRSNGNSNFANQVRNNVLTLSLVLSAVVGLLYFVIVQFIFSWDSDLYKVLLMVIPYSITTIMFNMVLVDLLASKKSIHYSFLTFIRALLNLSVGFLLVFLNNSVFVILLSEILITLIIIFFIIKYFTPGSKLDFSFGVRLCSVVKTGLPFSLTNLLKNLSTNLDKIFVASLFPIAIFSQYTFAMIIYGGGLLVTTIIGTLFKPYLIGLHMNTQNPHDIFLKACKLSFAILFVMILLWWPILTMIEWCVISYFPNYTQAIPLFPVIYISTLFVSINVFDAVILAFGRGGRMLFFYATISVIYLVAILVLSRFNVSLIDYAFAFGLMQCSLLIISIYLSWYEVKRYRIKFKTKNLLT